MSNILIILLTIGTVLNLTLIIELMFKYEDLSLLVKCCELRVDRLEQWYFELPTKFVRLPKDVEEK